MIRRQQEGIYPYLLVILPYNAPRIVVPKADYTGVIFFILVSTLMQGTAAGIYGIRRLQIKCCASSTQGLAPHLTVAMKASQIKFVVFVVVTEYVRLFISWLFSNNGLTFLCFMFLMVNIL